MKVENFTYNGFSGNTLKGFTSYTANFIKWTNDPGIAVCSCSDGKERLIPTFALVDFDVKDFPEQTYEGGKLIFGVPCNSK